MQKITKAKETVVKKVAKQIKSEEIKITKQTKQILI